MTRTESAGDAVGGLPVGHADVVVAGYGPVGAVLAALLGQRGLRVLVVERDREPFPLPRALAVDDEVLRTMVRLPGMNDLLSRVNGLQRAAFVDRNHRVLAEIAFGESVLGMPGLAFFHQPSMERQLRAGVATLPGVRTLLGHAVTDLRQDSTGVEVTLAGHAPVRGRYLVGCDGAASTVRRALGISFHGTTFAQSWLVVDTEIEQPLRHLPYFSYVCDPARPAVSMPMPGGHRFEWMLLPGEDPERIKSPSSIRDLLRPSVDPDLVRVVRSRVYALHDRTAERWRAGRVLLAGDAAHCMPQFAGQGMGAGIRDAVALAWRLAEVVGTRSDEVLLDQYEAERRPHAATMTQLALLAGSILQSTDPWVSMLIRTLLRATFSLPLLGTFLAAGGLRPSPRVPALRQTGRLAPFASGWMLPNPRVRTLAGRVVRLDDVLPTEWALLASGDDPARGLAAQTRAWLDSRDAALLAVVRPGGLRAVAHLSCPAVEDLDGTLLRLLRSRRRHRGWNGRSPGRASPAPGFDVRVAVVRPDRFLLGVLPAGAVDDALARWQTERHLPQTADLRATLLRRLARLAFKPSRVLLVGGDGIPLEDFHSTPVQGWIRR